MKIKITSIKIERSDRDKGRFRKDFGDVEEMKESLKRYGLIHPIVVDKIEGDNSFDYTLVAGERRLTAAMLLGWTEIDATVRDELSSLQRKELELEENVQRKDISWQENVEALRQLDELKRSMYGSRMPGDASDAGWTITDTAKTAKKSLGTISQDIALAKKLHENPELREKIGNLPKMAARKIIEREENKERMKSLVEKRQIKLTSELSLGDCTELIKFVPDKSISLLITDPPWAAEGINEVAKGNLSGKYDQGDSSLGEEEEMKSVYQKLVPQLSRVMIPGGHFYLFFAIQWYDYLCNLLRENEFIVHPSPLVWPKGRSTMIPNPYHYVPCYELILFGARSPQSRTLLKPRPNLLEGFPCDSPQIRVHSLQKPIELMKMFIENSTVPGELVLDPFAGSGVVLKAAKELGRQSLGFEKNENTFYASQRWLGRNDDDTKA